jgi:SOS-response transcriptional repressor LexA
MDFSQRILRLRQTHDLTQGDLARRLGITSNYVSLLENGQREPSNAITSHFDLLERAFDCGLFTAAPAEVPSGTSGHTLRDEPRYQPRPVRAGNRQVPLIGWAHAGDVTNYEEIPHDWREWVETDSRDEKAFAVRIEGDSMGGAYQPHDVLILSPSYEIYSGCLAVLKMRSDGFVFRQVEKRLDHLKLIPLNARWSIEEMPLAEIEWAYPVYAMYRQVWKK